MQLEVDFFLNISVGSVILLAVISPQRSQSYNTGVAFITNTPVITTV